jgi:RimJ/RimL family protein N-acetyltransferase
VTGGGGVRLDRVRPVDLDWLERWMQPHQDWHRWDGPYFPKMSAEQVAGWIHDIRTGRDTVERYVIRLDGRRVGTCTWRWEHESDGWARCGLTVYDPAERGRGIGREALGILAGLVFEGTAAHRLDLATWSGNHAMCRAALAAGFVEEARFREARVVRGERYDSVCFGMLRATRAG